MKPVVATLIFIWLLIICAVIYTWRLNDLPLTAYDEVVYAQVTRDTMHSDSLWSLQRFGKPWLEKPPLYFWFAMGSTAVFGDHEWAYRLPSVLAALGISVMVFLILHTLGLGKRWSVAAVGVLTSIPYWFILMRQVRVDSLLIMFFLIAVFFLVMSWRHEKYALGIAPAIALAIMTKSVAALSAVLILLIFAAVYRQWMWLRSKWFYLGCGIALVLIAPWHIYQVIVHGQNFWSVYLGFNIVQRATQGFGAQQTHWYDYVMSLWRLAQPWFTMWIISTIAACSIWRRHSIGAAIRNLWLASLGVTFVIIVLFSCFRTHIPTYILTIYPFMAVTIVCNSKIIYEALLRWRPKLQSALVIAGVLVFGLSVWISFRVGAGIMPGLHFSFDPELKAIGQTMAQEYKAGDTFYQLAWPVGDTLSYYAQQPIRTIPIPRSGEQVVISGPSYIFLQTELMPLFMDDQGKIAEAYAAMRLKYRSDHFVLLYSDKTITLQN